MLQEIELKQEKENKRRGWIFSAIFHALIVLLILLPILKYPVPPPGQQGILVSFGTPDMGQGDSRPDTQQDEVVDPKPPSEEEQITEPVEASQPTPATEQSKEVVTTETPAEVAFRKKEEERKKQEETQKRLEEQRKREAEEAEKRRQAEEAAKKAELEKAKKQFGDAFGGTGKGKTDKPGNQGDPGGDPDAKALEGISTGQGTIGGGLEGRGVVSAPTITDNSQKTGRVVIRICVDKTGSVVSAEYTQAGSTTTDGELRRIAETNARKFRFSASSIDRQCGTVTIDFRVR
jgi:hypothetical protein